MRRGDKVWHIPSRAEAVVVKRRKELCDIDFGDGEVEMVDISELMPLDEVDCDERVGQYRRLFEQCAGDASRLAERDSGGSKTFRSKSALARRLFSPKQRRFRRMRENDADVVPPSLTRRVNRAVDTFESFHDFPYRDVSEFDSRLTIPSHVYVPGPCRYVTYRSDKWGKGTYDYIHEIDSYPRVAIGYPKLVEEPARRRALTARAREDNQVFNLIGKCLGWSFTQGDEDVEIKAPAGCEWWWSPSSKILIAVKSRRSLVVVAWGGKLDVEDRGIVG